VTEIGRQPWLVHGVLTTAQAAGPVPAASIASTLVMYLVMYALLLAAYIGTLYRLAARGHAAETSQGKMMPPRQEAAA
jgi:cytochrome d ubiquinol oxidase subunit I